MDVRLQRAGRDAALVRLAVRLHLVRLPRDERGGVGQIRDCPVEFAHADPPVSAMPVHARVLGVFGHALREDLDRVAVAPRVPDAAAEPDDRVGVVGVGVVVGAGRGDVIGPPGGHVGRCRWRVERLAEQGEGFGALGQRRSDGGRGRLGRSGIAGTAVCGAASGEERGEERGVDEEGAMHVDAMAGVGGGAWWTRLGPGLVGSTGWVAVASSDGPPAEPAPLCARRIHRVEFPPWPGRPLWQGAVQKCRLRS